MLKKAFGSSAKSQAQREAKKRTEFIFEESKLAPSFGELTSQTIEYIDDELKIAIAGVTNQISKIPDEERTWNRVIGVFSNCTLIVPKGEEILRADVYTRSGKSWLKGGSGLQQGIVQEVLGWFTELISDADVLEVTKIDINEIARIVATTGAVVDKLYGDPSSDSSSSYRERSILEFGILRYPDVKEQYFNLYSIQLFAWAEFRAGMFSSNNDNGIRGVFQKRKYAPNRTVIEKIDKKIQDQAVRDAEDLFSDDDELD